MSDLKCDNSAVFHIDVIDEDKRDAFDPGRPWIFDCDEYQFQFETQDAACDHQRAYRTHRGFDPITGELK